jgi:DNA mismatch endonuclease (patch repair protein)
MEEAYCGAFFVDTLTAIERSERMGRVRCKDTKPELIVRRLVHSLGFRYRLHDGKLPGKPDLVFSGRRKVIFVHGCFWHRHGARCPLTRLPKSKLDFWRPKLEQNRRRDKRNSRSLKAAGWGILIVWECELRNRESIKARIMKFLGSDTC